MLLRIEFTAMDSLQPSGELLPHLSTLTVVDANFTFFAPSLLRQVSFVPLRLHFPPKPLRGFRREFLGA